MRTPCPARSPRATRAGGWNPSIVVGAPRSDWYGRLMGKRLTGRFFTESVADHGWHACDYLLADDMEMEPVPGYAFASWEKGYGDVRLVPDWGTLRRSGQGFELLARDYRGRLGAKQPGDPVRALWGIVALADERPV